MRYHAPVTPLLRALRPAQWVKNGFVAAPILFAGLAGSPWAWARVAAAVGLWCALSSAVYLMNDLVDVESDRRHPHKRHRPLAAGTLSPALAAGTASVLGVGALVGGFALDTLTGTGLAAYALLNGLYTLRLKRVVIVDVMVVASGFVLRVLTGSWVIHVPPSAWLLVNTGILALFLGFAKRRQELAGADAEGTPASRAVLDAYTVPFLDLIQTVLAATGAIAYAIYTVSPRTVAHVGDERLLLTAPLVLHGFLRYLWLVQVRGQGENPTRIALRDPGIRWTVLAWLALSAALLYA